MSRNMASSFTLDVDAVAALCGSVRAATDVKVTGVHAADVVAFLSGWSILAPATA